MDWDEMARPWLLSAPELEIAFEQIFAALFDAVWLQPGETVLDIGCGTGPTLVAAAEAVGPQGRVTGVDVAPPLLARAAERVPETVDLVTADAGSHAFPPEHFDVVLSNFGIMFFADNAAAFANLRHATKRGGRLAATVWGVPPDNPWFSVPRRIVDGIVADVPRPDIEGPGPMRFGDPAGLLAILETAGWAPKVTTHDLHLLPPGPPEQVADHLMLLNIGNMLRGIEVSEEALARIKGTLLEALRGRLTEGQVRVPARIHVVTATAV